MPLFMNSDTGCSVIDMPRKMTVRDEWQEGEREGDREREIECELLVRPDDDDNDDLWFIRKSPVYSKNGKTWLFCCTQKYSM